MITPLSLRVGTWFNGLALRRTREPLEPEATRAWLRKRARPSWQTAVDVEVAFGGVIGRGADGGVVSFGVHPWFGRLSVFDGRAYALVGYIDPVSVFVDEAGAVVEVSDDGDLVGAADSLAQRLEQRALETCGRVVEVFDGRHGLAWATVLDLVPLVEACDAHQQWWATTPQSPTTSTALLMKQWHDDDGWHTMLCSDEPLLLEAALTLVKS